MLHVIAPAPYTFVGLGREVKAITVNTGDSRGIVTVNNPVGVYAAADHRMTVRGQNHTGTAVRLAKGGRLLSVVLRNGTTEVI